MDDFMTQALELANEALKAQEVPVGCIFVCNNEIVASSRNTVNETRNPTRHAEFNCIDQVLKLCADQKLNWKEYFSNIEVYVTVEPCIMCAAALNEINVKKVVFGCANDRFGGKTVFNVDSVYDRSYELVGGVKGDEAMALLKNFYKGSNPLAPESKQKKKKKDECDKEIK